MTEVRVRTFVKDSIILAASNAGARLVNFLLLPVYTAALAPSVYGITDMTLNFAWLLAIALSLQMDWGLQSSFHDEEGEGYRCRLTSTVFAYFAVAAALAMFLITLASPIAGLLLGDVTYGPIVAMGLVIVAASLVTSPLTMATRMRGRMKVVAAFNFIGAVLVVFMTLAAIFFFRLGAASLIFANMVASVVVAALYLGSNRSTLSWRGVDLVFMKRLMVASAPVLVTSLLIWVNDLSDKYVIAWFFSQAEVGLYGIATRLNGVLYVFAWGVIMAYGPFASANTQAPASRPKYQISFDLATMFMALLCFFAAVFSKEIVALMTAPEYHGAYVAVPFLLYGVAFNILNALVGYAFTIKKTGRNYLAVYSVCAAVNLVLNIILVPRYGFMAASVTTFASYALLFFLSLKISEKLFPVGYDIKRLLLVIGVPGALVWPLLQADSLFLKGLAFLGVTLYIGGVYASRVGTMYAEGRGWLSRKGFGAFHG